MLRIPGARLCAMPLATASERAGRVLALVVATLFSTACGEDVTSQNDPTGCLPSSSDTWIQDRNSRSQLPVSWSIDALCVPWHHDPRNHKGLASARLSETARAAFDTWSNAPCTAFCATASGTTDVAAGPPRAGYDLAGPNQNVVYAEPSPDAWAILFGNQALSATLVTSDLGTGEILDADIVLNLGAYVFVDADMAPNLCATVAEADLLNVVTHEVGHALGLDHNGAPGTAMYGMWKDPDGDLGDACEVDKRSLAAGDAAGVRTLYPAPACGPCPK